MPFLAVTIFVSLYGTVAVGLTCIPLFQNSHSPAAITTGLAGGRLVQRGKKMKKGKNLLRFWRNKKSNGVPTEPPQPRPTRQVSHVHASGTFVAPQSFGGAFEGFTAEHPAAHVPVDYQPSIAAETPEPVSQPQPRLRRMSKIPRLSQMDKMKLIKQKKPKEKKITLRPNVASFSDNYELIKTFSVISQGVVHLVKHRTTGTKYIIKQLLAEDPTTGEPKTPDEAQVLMTGLQKNKNILRLIDCSFYWDRDVRMANAVFEYCDAGDVWDFTANFPAHRTPEWFILHFVSSMIDALAFMHHGDVGYDADLDATSSIRHRQVSHLHRDLKPNNIFVKWESGSKLGLPTVVLGDFGFAEPTATNNGLAYTEGYISPELQSKIAAWKRDHSTDVRNAHTVKTDLYAFGVSVWEVMTNDPEHPYEPGVSNIRKTFENSSVSQHKGILTLLERCLAADPAKRPEANELHSLSAGLKARLQSWYDQGARVADDLLSVRPGGYLAMYLPPGYSSYLPQGSSHFSKGSSHYSPATTMSGPPSPRHFQPGAPKAPPAPRPDRKLNSSTRAVFDQSPTMTLSQTDADMLNLMPPLQIQNRTTTPSTSDTGKPQTNAETLINLSTGEPADVLSTAAEADKPAPSVFSWTSSEDSESLYS